VFQSDLSWDLVFALKCSYPFVHKHGLHDGFQHVIMINLTRLTDFISFSHIGTQDQDNSSIAVGLKNYLHTV